MNRKHLAAAVIFCAALALNGCAGAGGASAGGGNNANTNTSRQPEAVAGAAPAANTAAAPQTTSAVNAAPAPAAAGRGGDKAKAADAPQPQIGSGGNDFFLFTQARAALGNDAELKGASPVIEVKDGVLTLSGTVATQAQKSRAEQVARGVGGVKSVRNQLRVSAGG